MTETKDLVRTVFYPKDKEDWLKVRSKHITSTEVPALFDLSPYMSKFELWHRKKNRTIAEIEENERMKWGTRLQDSIAKGIAEDKNFDIKKYEAYIYINDLRIGSSFDFRGIIPQGANKGEDDLVFLLEIKNVDSLAFKEGWEVTDDSVEAPLHIELQVQHQLLVSGLERAYIGALIGGNRVVLIERKADPIVHKSILEKCAEFWDSIDACKEPDPDFKRDADFIKKLHNYVVPEKIIDASERVAQLAERYKIAADEEKAAKEEKEAFKAEMLTLIGDAEKVKGEKFSISAGIVGPCPISYTREGYRDFRIFWKKEPKNA